MKPAPSHRTRGRPGIAFWLILLCALAAVPIVAFATIAVHRQTALVEAEVVKDLRLQSQVAAFAVSSEIKSLHSLLVATTELGSARVPDFRAMHELAQRVVRRDTRLLSISVVGRDGSRPMSTLSPFGQAAAPVAGQAGQLVRDGYELGVSALLSGANRGAHVVEIAAPLHFNAQTAYELRTTVAASVIQAALEERAWSDGWLATVIDQDFRVIARSREPYKHVGRRLPDQTIDALQGNTADFVTISLDGELMRLSAHAVPGTPWLVAVGRPVVHIEQGIAMAITKVVAAGVACLGMATALAVMFAGWISNSIDRAVTNYHRGDKDAASRIAIRRSPTCSRS